MNLNLTPILKKLKAEERSLARQLKHVRRVMRTFRAMGGSVSSGLAVKHSKAARAAIGRATKKRWKAWRAAKKKGV